MGNARVCVITRLRIRYAFVVKNDDKMNIVCKYDHNGALIIVNHLRSHRMGG